MVEIDQTERNQMMKIDELFYRLAREDDLSDASISNDFCLLTYWLEIKSTRRMDLEQEVSQPLTSVFK